MKIIIYRYQGSIFPHKEKARYKGEIISIDPNKPDIHPSWKNNIKFDFLAPNNEMAKEYLNMIYCPDDSRPLRISDAMLEFKREVVDNPPKLWVELLTECMYSNKQG